MVKRKSSFLVRKNSLMSPTTKLAKHDRHYIKSRTVNSNSNKPRTTIARVIPSHILMCLPTHCPRGRHDSDLVIY